MLNHGHYRFIMLCDNDSWQGRPMAVDEYKVDHDALALMITLTLKISLAVDVSDT